MKKWIISAALFVFVCTGVLRAGSLESLCQKLPEDTFCFVGTSGTSNFQSDFEESIIGQIAADPQVKTFVDQVIASLSKSSQFKEMLASDDALGDDYIAFVKGLVASPTVLALAPTSERLSDEPCGIVLSEAIAPESDQGKLFAKLIQARIDSGDMIQKRVNAYKVYAPSDLNAGDIFYIAQMDDCFLSVFGDAEYKILNYAASNVSNRKLRRKLAAVASSDDAFVCYVDFQKLMGIVKEETAADPDAKQVLDVLCSLGIADIDYYVVKAGFEGKNLIIDATLKSPVSGGIWEALAPVDKRLLDLVDPKAIQANAVYISTAQLYDCIVNSISPIAQAEGDPIEPQIAELEQMLGFKFRDDLLASLEGSAMGYMLPPYTSPEMLTGGYVITARLKDAEKFKTCMLSLETAVKPMVPPGQLQITSQKDAAGKEVHIWGVSVLAMMQVIPSWAIEGDMLVFTSHPNITKKVMERIAAGSGPSMMSEPGVASAVGKIPGDAFAVSLADSKAQARQLMQALQQYLPMLNMLLAEEGIQLPIMLPSIEPYIEQMQPGMSYMRKAADGIEFHYEGTGLEATAGGAAGGAMGVAILMPALSKAKTSAQRVVCSSNLKGLSTAMMVYSMDYDDVLPAGNWCDLLIEEVDVSPKSFVCPQSDAIEGESSYAMNINVAGKNMGTFPPNVVMLFETDKGVEEGPRNTSVLTRRHHQIMEIYDNDVMVYKDRFNQVGGPEDIVLRHNNNGQSGCNIAFVDGHVEFVTKDRIAKLKWK